MVLVIGALITIIIILHLLIDITLNFYLGSYLVLVIGALITIINLY